MSDIDPRTTPETHDRFKTSPLWIRLLLKIHQFRIFQQPARASRGSYWQMIAHSAVKTSG